MAALPDGKSSPSSLAAGKASVSTPKPTGSEPPPTPPPTPKRYLRSRLLPLWIQWLKRTDRPILVGPWKTEVGFEALYWLPFLQYLTTCGVSRDRFIPITRGGAGVWYGAPKTLELFGMRTPQDVRIENKLQTTLYGQIKQTHVTAFDRGVLADAALTLGLKRRDYDVLHPAWMYQQFMPVWMGMRWHTWMRQWWTLEMLPAPDLPDGLTLPPQFLVARWYYRSTWPRNDQNEQFALEVLKLLAQQMPVILLTSGEFIDDHWDYLPDLPNVVSLKALYPGLTAENNLWVQSAVIGRAQGYVGTYGGLAQLALTMGKSSVTFYDQWGGTSVTHKYLSDSIALQTGRTFQVLKLGELPVLQSLLPKVVAGPA